MPQEHYKNAAHTVISPAIGLPVRDAIAAEYGSAMKEYDFAAKALNEAQERWDELTHRLDDLRRAYNSLARILGLSPMPATSQAVPVTGDTP